MNTQVILNSFRKQVGIIALVISGASMAIALAQQPQFNIVKPSTTGIPGEEVRVMTFDPAGNLWVAARWTFWGESGLAMLPADQLQNEPLPGGGFDTRAWKVWSSVQHPIPSPYVNDIKFSADGTMWIASEGGLTRFRPKAGPNDMWFTYTPANSPMTRNEVRSLAIDSQGNLWISNATVNYTASALFKLNTATGQWTRINMTENPWAVAVGNNDHVFISMIDIGGMMEFDGTSWVLHAANPRELTSLMQDAQGNVWAAGSGISGDGLWKWNGSNWRNWPQVGGTITVTGIGKDRDGVVYVSTWYGGIYKMINNNLPVFFAAADNIPRSVIGRPNGDIWINNYGGNGTIGTVRHYTANGELLSRMNTYNSGLPDYFVDRITRDSAGNMWFATGEAGLSRMLGSNGAPNAATHWRNWGNHNDQSEPYPWVGNEPMYSVFEDANGIFWMGGNGVGRWDSNTGQFTGFWNWENSNIDNSGVEAITKRAGTTWVGTGGSGVFWFDGTNWNRVLLSSGEYSYSPNNVRAMAVDTQNNLWVASESGLRKFAAGNNSAFTLYDSSNFPNAGLTDVEADPNGGIWVATYSGLVRLIGATTTIYNQANTGMPGTVVADVARRASDGLIAIASFQGSTFPYTGGVSTFDGTTWTHYTMNNSPLTHWQVEAVEFDANGNLWASCMSEGVVQILIGPAAPLQIVSAVSRKTHGSAGVFDISLPLTGEPAVECRSSAGMHTLVFSFDRNLVSGSAQIGAGTATLSGNPIFASNTMTVNLSGVLDQQTVSVALTNVTAASGGTLPNTAVSLRFVAGDTNGNGTVNASDVSQTKLWSGQAVTNVTFRSDVVVSGTINSSDIALVKSRSGSGAQTPAR
jgi:ligand-binding sensor domain-containing protein